MAVKTRVHRHHSKKWYVNFLLRLIGTSRIISIFKRLAYLTAAFSAIFLAYIKFSEYIRPEDNPIFEWVFKRRVSAIFYLLLIQSASQLMIFFLGFARRFDRPKVEKALNAIVGRHLGGSDDEECDYRATLFKERRFPVIGSWLGMVARSGEKYRRLRTIFSVHHSDHKQNTGIAGECWWREKTILLVTHAIDEDGESDAAEERIRKYKKSTFLADQEYECMTVKGCIFLATCIKINGKKWGVLLLDSTDPKIAPDEVSRKARIEDLEHTADMLSMLLQ